MVQGRSGKAAKAEKISKPNLDPQLANIVRKDSNAELAESLQPLFATMPTVRRPVTPKPTRPRLYLWSTRQPESYQAIPLELSSPPMPTASLYPWPCHDPIPFRPSLRTPTATSLDDGESVPEAMKLKGVVWPGMDIFDAATPGMKRKRNQKKDDSVLELLEQSSLAVEATEMIFTPLGALKKSRVITGQADFDSSPLLSQISPRPRQRVLKRPVLTDRCVNNNNNISRDGSGMQPRMSAFGFPVTSSYRARATESKRTFAVFNDHATEASSFSEHPGMRLLTSSFPSDVHSNSSIQYASSGGYTFSPHPAYGSGFFEDPTDALQNLYGHSSFYASTALGNSQFFDPDGTDMPTYAPHDSLAAVALDLKRESHRSSECRDSQDSYIPADCRGRT